MKPDRTLYDVLEVSQHASPVVVKAAYRSLAQSLHPDKNSGTLAAGERLAEINDAYAVVLEMTAAHACRLPFDIARTQYANAVRIGLVRQSMLAWAGFERCLSLAESATLGRWARRN